MKKRKRKQIERSISLKDLPRLRRQREKRQKRILLDKIKRNPKLPLICMSSFDVFQATWN